MSCLFDSLSSLEGRGEGASLRKEICRFIAGGNLHSEIYGGDAMLFEMPLSAYVSKMHDEKEWGGAVEIRAFCEMRRVSVVVHCANRMIEFLPDAEQLTHFFHVHWNGAHYTPLHRTSEGMLDVL